MSRIALNEGLGVQGLGGIGLRIRFRGYTFLHVYRGVNIMIDPTILGA